jgi:serine/threonine protein kinase
MSFQVNKSVILCDLEPPRKIKSAPVTPDINIRLKRKPKFTSQYTIIDAQIGKGASAVVKKCTRKSDKKQFAVKIMNKKTLKKRQLFLIQQEISILEKLRDKGVKNVVQLIDFYDEEDTMYIVMELAEKNLFEWLLNRFDGDKFKINEKKCAYIFFQMVRAIHGCHKVGIIHRDIKPENILMTDTKKTKICLTDFGLSTYKTSMKTICGTPNYLAPEVVLKRKYTSKCDWWSAGVCLYVILSGTYPFCDTNVTNLYKKIVKNDYDFNDLRWKYISREAKDLITLLLDPNPNTRCGHNQILSHPWMRQHLF